MKKEGTQVTILKVDTKGKGAVYKQLLPKPVSGVSVQMLFYSLGIYTLMYTINGKKHLFATCQCFVLSVIVFTPVLL